jgi:hypothetical protein
MARKKDLAEKLGGSGETVPGWRDVVASGQDPAEQARLRKTESYQRKTYLIAPDTIKRIAKLAKQERVGVNELVRYLIDFALDEIESGRHKIPTQAEEYRRIVS